MKIIEKKKEDSIEYWGDITKSIESLIGKNIISSAYILIFDDISNSLSDDISNSLSSEIPRMAKFIMNEFKKSGMLLCEDAKVVITFKNGNTLVFSSSEWGYIKKCDKIEF